VIPRPTKASADIAAVSDRASAFGDFMQGQE
jgi:hypothetical protein